MNLDHVSIHEASRALQENVREHLRQDTHPILRNQNIALLGICHSLEKLTRDVEILHSKLQPILKSIIDDQHTVQDMTRR